MIIRCRETERRSREKFCLIFDVGLLPGGLSSRFQACHEKIVLRGLTASRVAEHVETHCLPEPAVSFRPMFIAEGTVAALAATGFGMTIGGTTTMPSRAGDG